MKKEKEAFLVMIKKDNINRLRLIKKKFGIEMSTIIDSLLDDFFYKFRKEIDDEEVLQFLEKYITEKRLREEERGE